MHMFYLCKVLEMNNQGIWYFHVSCVFTVKLYFPRDNYLTQTFYTVEHCCNHKNSNVVLPFTKQNSQSRALGSTTS